MLRGHTTIHDRTGSLFSPMKCCRSIGQPAEATLMTIGNREPEPPFPSVVAFQCRRSHADSSENKCIDWRRSDLR